jgi:hypothetical protein
MTPEREKEIFSRPLTDPSDDYTQGWIDAWNMAHSPAPCGHARANWKDPNFGKPEYQGDERCEICAALDAVKAALTVSEAKVVSLSIKLGDKDEDLVDAIYAHFAGVLAAKEAERKRLKETLRRRAVYLGLWGTCDICLRTWSPEKAERHLADCPAAPDETPTL